MAQQFKIVGIKKPGGSDNRTTHITEVLVEGPIPAASLLGQYGILGGGLFPQPSLSGLRPRSLKRPAIWRTVESVIADIENGEEFFYTDRDGNRAEVIVAQRTLLRRLGELRSRTVSRKYIKTRSDNTSVDNLLSLPNYDRG